MTVEMEELVDMLDEVGYCLRSHYERYDISKHLVDEVKDAKREVAVQIFQIRKCVVQARRVTRHRHVKRNLNVGNSLGISSFPPPI